MRDPIRHIIQGAAALIINPNLKGFISGRIYSGGTKHICVPGLNCYSCPAAAGACPVGSLQTALTGERPGAVYYTAGILILFGVLLGRLVCGFLCPFGFLQDILHKIKTPKVRLPQRVDNSLRYAKYAVLVLFSVLLPMLLRDSFGLGTTYFCKYICPAGTLQGGIPLLIADKSLRGAAGRLFIWKAVLLAVIVAASIFIYRPFCKYLCPLGAFYALFNKVGLYQMDVDAEKCTGCGACTAACGMGVKVTENINSPECIRCGRCRSVCAYGAISSGLRGRPKKDGAR